LGLVFIPLVVGGIAAFAGYLAPGFGTVLGHAGKAWGLQKSLAAAFGGMGLVVALWILLGYWGRKQITGLPSLDAHDKIPPKFVWDWLQLIIVPLVLAIGGIVYGSQQEQLQQRHADDQYNLTVLTNYEDQVINVVGTYHMLSVLSQSPEGVAPAPTPDADYQAGGEVLNNIVGEAFGNATLNVPGRLDQSKKGTFLQFLAFLGLLQEPQEGGPVVKVAGSDLRGARLPNAILRGTDLEGIILTHADLKGANLANAQLNGGHFEGADLTRADLQGTMLDQAHFNLAHLDFACLRRIQSATNTDFTGAYLHGAILPGMHFKDPGETFGGTNITGAYATNDEKKYISPRRGLVGQPVYALPPSSNACNRPL
jgi:hypothetical protein